MSKIINRNLVVAGRVYCTDGLYFGNEKDSTAFRVMDTNGTFYQNRTSSSTVVGKFHNHLTTSEVGGLETKGEFINTTGGADGISNTWNYTPTGATGAPDNVRSVMGNTVLTAANTITGGNMVGTYGQVINSGTMNGAATTAFGLVGSIAGAGATTLVSHIGGVCSSVGSTVVNPTTGELSSYVATNLGTTVIDNLMYVVGNATTTNVFNFADTTGCCAGGSVATQSGASTGSLVIKIGASAYKIPYFS